MVRGNIKLDNPARYAGKYEIPAEKIQATIKKATDKWLKKLDEFGGLFPGACSKEEDKYKLGENNTWTQGMHTGATILAYELTGNERFLEHAKEQIKTYFTRYETKTGLWDHDVGFVYTPSVIALYRLTGDESLKELAIKAANHLYDNMYSQKGGFIQRSFDASSEPGCRTMMDTLMNIPLFFWTYEQTGEQKFLDAAKSQLAITESCLIREDGSSFHHYQFEVETHKPVRGLTFQGHSDDSCWSRGHSWGVYGFPVAYTYTKDESLLPLHRDVCYFVLNHLPEDNIPYYDYDFVEKCDEARDSSAALVNACGMLEACKYLPDTAEEKEYYRNAAMMMIEGVIDNCMDYDNKDFDGLINWVTCSAPHNLCIDGCTSYGDFFLLEALKRITDPDWKRYW
ncbi:MAG: glycoside hydrolase family 88 protein [Clostridia bacterium]|nr:glycoside hydrolase family 88 protein [Clostridia bacterium]